MNKKEPGCHNRNGKKKSDFGDILIASMRFRFEYLQEDFSFLFLPSLFMSGFVLFFLYIPFSSVLGGGGGGFFFFFFFDWGSPHFPFSPLFQPSLFGFFWFLSFGSSTAGSHGDPVMGIGICGVSLVQYIILPLVCLGWDSTLRYRGMYIP